MSPNASNDDFQSAFDGLMLGDGCVNIEFRYVQECKYKDWLDALKLWFIEHGFCANVYSRNRHPSLFNPVGQVIHQLQTCNKDYFSKQRKRWYTWTDQDGWEYKKIQKTVPEDIILTPEGVANWYMGDGCFVKTVPQISFATNGFSESDVDFLCSMLEYIDVKAHKHTHRVGYMVYVTKKSSIETLIEYVRPFVNPVYNYKIGVGSYES